MKPTQTPSFPAAMRAARCALQWRLLLLWVLWMLAPTAILGLAMWNMLSDGLDHSVRAAELARRLDMTALTDLLALHGKNSMAITGAGVTALVATLLLSPLLAAMAASAARSRETQGFGALSAAGFAGYPRMFRMMLWSIVPLGLAAAAGGAILDAASARAGAAILESSAELAQWTAMGAALLLLALVHATLDAGRAALALDRRRSSAVKAWWDGCRLLARRPLAAFGSYLLVTVAGLGIAAALAVARINVAGYNLAGFIGAMLLVQLTVAAIGAMRCARLFALVEASRGERG